ncbi:MAG: hypothetical protein CMJ31_11230 [Phycisphaerae bacterium]|nr:hypothetical protein [Phycisphaerae bacterium]
MDLGLLVQSFLAALIGTAAMTLSMDTEAVIVGRDRSRTAGKAICALARGVCRRPMGERTFELASIWGRWLFGVSWGIALCVLVDPWGIGLPLPWAGAVLFVLVWGAAQIGPPLITGDRPSLMYGFGPMLIEAWHHLVYASMSLSALGLMRWAGG